MSLEVMRQRKSRKRLRPLAFRPTEKDLSCFLDLFIGREVGYARYFIESTGKTSYSHVQGVIGFAEVMEHLQGKNTYALYSLRSDRTLKHCAIRIRIPWRKVVANIKNTGFLSISEDNVDHDGREVVQTSKEYLIPAYLECPGGRERRIWFFFEEFIPLEMAERFLNSVLDTVPAPGLDLSFDLLLGFRGTGIGSADHPIMLPLGINRGTGRRSFFFDEDGTPYEDQILFIKKIRTISRDGVRDFLRTVQRGSERFSQPIHDSLKRLQENCPVIRELLRKASSGRNLRHEEKLVLYFTVGFLKDGFHSLHLVLEPCPDYRPGKVDRMTSRLGSNPISCPKIRQLLPQTTAYLKCDCSFDVPLRGYPSPLLQFGICSRKALTQHL